MSSESDQVDSFQERLDQFHALPIEERLEFATPLITISAERRMLPRRKAAASRAAISGVSSPRILSAVMLQAISVTSRATVALA